MNSRNNESNQGSNGYNNNGIIRDDRGMIINSDFDYRDFHPTNPINIYSPAQPTFLINTMNDVVESTWEEMYNNRYGAPSTREEIIERNLRWEAEADYDNEVWSESDLDYDGDDDDGDFDHVTYVAPPVNVTFPAQYRPTTPANNTCFCLDDETEQPWSELSCGHKVHTTCIMELIRHNDNPVCPYCRSDLRVPFAEGGSPVTVEYAAVPVGTAEMEFDDPVQGLDNIVTRDLNGPFMHVYVLTGNVEGHYIGDIVQVNLLIDDEWVTQQSGGSSYVIRQKGEWQIIVAMRSKLQLAPTCVIKPAVRTVDQTVRSVTEVQPKTGNGITILIVAQGTTGDIDMLAAIREAIRERGWVCDIISNHEKADIRAGRYGFDHLLQGTIAGELLDQANALPSMMSLTEEAIRYIRRHKTHLIVSTYVTAAVSSVARAYGIPYVCISAQPLYAGSFAYTAITSKFTQFLATHAESFFRFATASIMTFDRQTIPYEVPLDATNTIVAVAPELQTHGVGFYLPPIPPAIVSKSDVFITFGSMVKDNPSKSKYMLYYNLLKDSPFRVCMQCPPIGDAPNIQFVGRAPHGPWFAETQVVLCHGGAGTVQTALYAGAHVLVDPYMVDQKFWPPLCLRKGYSVSFVRPKTFLEDLKLLTKQRPNQTLTPFSLERMALDIMSRAQYRPYTPGWYIIATPINEQSFKQRVMHNFQQWCHTAIGYYDGATSVTYDFEPVELNVYTYQGFFPCARAKLLPNFDGQLFHQQLKELMAMISPNAMWGLMMTCQTLTQYLTQGFDHISWYKSCQSDVTAEPNKPHQIEVRPFTGTGLPPARFWIHNLFKSDPVLPSFYRDFLMAQGDKVLSVPPVRRVNDVSHMPIVGRDLISVDRITWDQYLQSLRKDPKIVVRVPEGHDYAIRPCPKDGACLFTCFSIAQKMNMLELRRTIINYVADNYADWLDTPPEEYRTRFLSDVTQQGTHVEIDAFTRLFNKKIYIVGPGIIGRPYYTVGAGESHMFYYTGGHYDYITVREGVPLDDDLARKIGQEIRDQQDDQEFFDADDGRLGTLKEEVVVVAAAGDQPYLVTQFVEDLKLIANIDISQYGYSTAIDFVRAFPGLLYTYKSFNGLCVRLVPNSDDQDLSNGVRERLFNNVPKVKIK